MTEIHRAISVEATVDAPQREVWEAWTTEAGARSFLAPAYRVELRVGGAYEMYFNLDAPPGGRGGEGIVVLAFQEPDLLSFTWNAPPELATVRPQHTHVVVRFSPLSPGSTRMSLHHDGWGQGGEWDEAFRYFQSAWGRSSCRGCATDLPWVPSIGQTVRI